MSVVITTGLYDLTIISIILSPNGILALSIDVGLTTEYVAGLIYNYSIRSSDTTIKEPDMENFNEFTKEELEVKLRDLEDLLEEVYEEKGIILGQQNVHLSSKLVNKYAKEVEEIKGKIEKVKDLLKTR